MNSAQDVPDSTDWLHTPLKDFAQLETALHCQICKEFYDTPMITSCSHTFCSRCIRTSLSADGRCPACRTADQASKLRKNSALQEVVATFMSARPAAICVARREVEQATQKARPGKRKRAVLDLDDLEQAQGEGRTTRSKSRRTAASETSTVDAIEVEDSDEGADETYEPEIERLPDDGLLECPLGCGKRMKIEQVEPHLDRCEDEKQSEKREKHPAQVNGYLPKVTPRQNGPPRERLAELNYSLLKELPMRKKLEEIGIPGWGSKQLMIKRHTEWVNLWNADCDSDHPRSKRDLLQDLETWERTQGGRAPSTHGLSNGVMRKDFDGAGWASKHGDEYSRLIADARRKKSNPAMVSSSPKDQLIEENAALPPMNSHEDSNHPVDDDTSDPTPQSATDTQPAPYAEQPEALASIREKVEAANAGKQIEPVMNQGFISQQPQPDITITIPAAAASGALNDQEVPVPQGSENPALLSQGHFGHPKQDKVVGNRDEHSPSGGRRGTPCELPAHLHGDSRKMPMFAVPSRPVSDMSLVSLGYVFHVAE
ncbi:E3 ubiquitin-protein ligase rad18 [Friedmanniomyces endolithicus]|uniref:Postreplication repair E3 ubiquitin-protein ligase RAD18 n=1 Tax=Friedmanniomyces endolithicus TaxID=329885 RepID=A0AAN6KYH8_9PEZI|nr:E3 ubiquitin-protein ligase rad18 [Friedmanniomyces endolithicus]KAK1007306.1 E3 ubiquitin-protein ligase rad18 [Friedmanniomyces endolithicus]